MPTFDWRCFATITLVSVILTQPLHSQGGTRQAGEIPFERYELANGLRVILAPDPTSTAVAVNLWYDVGSRHERRGRSGFGHLFEHLMFQGSDNVERGQHMQMVERNGGSLNASITEDRTNFFQTLPPDRYNLALWLESDRMRSLQVTEENMRREIEVVKEERRLRIDNAPYGTSQLQAFYYAPYDSTTCFPYAHSVIGSMDDLNAAQVEDVRNFFNTYYAPNNATLTVVGSFDAAEAKQLIQQYFGSIPRGMQPEPVQCTEPFRHLPVRQTVDDPNAQLPAIWMSFAGVPAGHPDSYALSMLGSILGQGETSRLNERLVRTDRAALTVQALPAHRRDPGILLLFAVSNQGIEPARLEQLVDEEIAKIRDGGVTTDELEKAKNRYRSDAIFGRQSVMGRAEALQWHNHFLGDPGAIRTEMEHSMAVTSADIQRVAREYLQPEKRSVIITRPAAATPTPARIPEDGR
jgi:zinc protease